MPGRLFWQWRYKGSFGKNKGGNNKNLTDFTEITDIRLDLKLDKKEIEERRDGRH